MGFSSIFRYWETYYICQCCVKSFYLRWITLENVSLRSKDKRNCVKRLFLNNKQEKCVYYGQCCFVARNVGFSELSQFIAKVKGYVYVCKCSKGAFQVSVITRGVLKFLRHIFSFCQIRLFNEIFDIFYFIIFSLILLMDSLIPECTWNFPY